jgi:hypothetical protein
MIDDASYVFGGYRTVAFSSGTGNRADNDAFLFRLLEAGQWKPVVCKVKQGGANAVCFMSMVSLMQQILDNVNYGPTFGGGSDLMMWNTTNYTLNQQTNGSTNVASYFIQPAGGPYALCGAPNSFVYTDFVAFHVRRINVFVEIVDLPLQHLSPALKELLTTVKDLKEELATKPELAETKKSLLKANADLSNTQAQLAAAKAELAAIADRLKAFDSLSERNKKLEGKSFLAVPLHSTVENFELRSQPRLKIILNEIASATTEDITIILMHFIKCTLDKKVAVDAKIDGAKLVQHDTVTDFLVSIKAEHDNAVELLRLYASAKFIQKTKALPSDRLVFGDLKGEFASYASVFEKLCVTETMVREADLTFAWMFKMSLWTLKTLQEQLIREWEPKDAIAVEKQRNGDFSDTASVQELETKEPFTEEASKKKKKKK